MGSLGIGENLTGIKKGSIVLKEKLDIAQEKENYPEISGLIVNHLESKYFFRPGFSNFDEIVVEFLCGQWISDPYLYIKERYKLSKREAKMVVDTLKKFSKWVD